MVSKTAFSSATTWEQQHKHEQKFFQENFKRPLIFSLLNSESVKGLSEINHHKSFSRKFQNLLKKPLIIRS